MTKLHQVYMCEVCGNMVEMLRAGVGQMVCCNQPMTLQEENTVDASREKHVPVVERVGDRLKVSVGSVPHPMTVEHHIEWIEVIAGATTIHEHLKPGDAPEAWFPLVEGDLNVRAYCNLHGLWKA